MSNDPFEFESVVSCFGNRQKHLRSVRSFDFTIDPEDAQRYREKLMESEESKIRVFTQMKLFLFVSDYSDKIGVFVGAADRAQAEELVYEEMRDMVYNQRDGMSDVVPDDFFTAFDVRTICKLRSTGEDLGPFATICNHTEGYDSIDLTKRHRGVPELTLNELKLLEFAFANLDVDESNLTSVNS